MYSAAAVQTQTWLGMTTDDLGSTCAGLESQFVHQKLQKLQRISEISLSFRKLT